MSLSKIELLKLMKASAMADKNAPVAFSFNEEKFTPAEVDDAVRAELQLLGGTYNLARENQNLIFELIESTIDDVLPKRVLEQYGAFADVQTFTQGDKPRFQQRISHASRMRAKQFVTKVGLAGIYETFKLDGQTLEVETMAIGGAAQIGLEEFLDGRITFGDVLDIVLAGMDEMVYREIARSLIASVTTLTAANRVSGAGFNEKVMDRLVATADAYGQSAIYCTYEFAATMVPATGWISEDQKNTMWNVGYIANYKGHRVIVLPQSFENVDNAVKVIDPSYAWIIPAGANSKPVKIAFEGQTITRPMDNKDGSREVHIYKKLGIGTIITNNICVYRNISLVKDNLAPVLP